MSMTKEMMATGEDWCEHGIEVRRISGDRGRGLVATRDFVKGETVFREKPMMSCQFSWNAEYGYRACHFCMEPLETAQENVIRLSGNANLLLPHLECCTTKPDFHVKCPDCGVAYCSESCLKQAYDCFHQTLCLRGNTDPSHPLVALQQIWKELHYPPEETSIMLMVRILASIVQSDADKQEALANRYLSMVHDVVDHSTQICHKLMGEQFAVPLETLRQGMSNFFASKASVQPFLTPNGFTSLFALVGRNGQGVGTSALSQWVRRVQKLSMKPSDEEHLNQLVDRIYDETDRHVGSFLNNEGSGLYYLQSKINHSCDPNAVVVFPFNNHELVVNCSKNIAAGEEILISYLDDCFQGRSRHSRQKYLLENYLFQCGCSLCASQIGDPDVTSEEDMSDEDEDECDDQD